MKEDTYQYVDMEPKKDSIIFYASWHKWISTLKPRTEAKAYKALFQYGFFGIPIPYEEFSASEYATLLTFIPTIDKNKRSYENGKKGAEHGQKGGRPKKQETPTGLSSQTPDGLSPLTPNDTVTDMETDIETVNVDDTVRNFSSSLGYQDLVKELLPIFFFKNNCNPARELKKFYDHYSKNGWKLTGGAVLDTSEKRKQAAEKWKVQNSQGPIFPPLFIGVWREIYNMLPLELQIDAVQIGSTSRGQYSVSLICSAALKAWLDDENNHDVVLALFQTKISPTYRFEYYARKEGA